MKILFPTITLLVIFFCISCTEDGGPSKFQRSESKVIVNSGASKIFKKFDQTKKLTKSDELKNNLVEIEKKYGSQWGFCECVIANDSINTAINKLSSFEGTHFEQLMKRSDIITQKCQAFLSMDANQTPEQRLKHEQKVRKCLKGTKNS